MNQRFYKRHEEMELRFYQMPKALFGNPIYKGLSLAAKAMYSILRDRQDLSIQNEWYDEEGNIFSIYTVEELAELIEMDRKAVMRYKQELVQYGLLIDKRIGQGKPNRLYVLKPEINNEHTYKKKTVEHDVQKSPNGTLGRSPKKGLQEVLKKDTNDTDIKETNNLIDCSGETAATSEMIQVDDPIYKKLEENASQCMIEDRVSLKDMPSYIGEIYLMLHNQFANQLDVETVDRACELFSERAFDWRQPFRMKIDMQNPVGFFNTCYKDAVKEYKAKGRKARH